MALKFFRALCATAAAVLVVRSAAAAAEQGVTVNYDLLVGDISFYNRTMVFALREDEAHGDEMLRLIEDLMAPWTAETAADDRCPRTRPPGDTVLVDVRLVASEWMVRAVIAAAAFGFFLFLLTAVFTVFSFPLTVYLTAKASATKMTATDAV